MSPAKNSTKQRPRKKGCCCKGGPMPLEEPMDDFKDSDDSLQQTFKIIKHQDGDSCSKAHLTEDVVSRYETERTPLGTSLARCIHINAKNKKERFPRIMDEACLSQYQEFFQPVMQDVYGKPGRPYVYNGEVNSQLVKVLQEHENVISFDVEMVRNVFGYTMGESLGAEAAGELGKLLHEALEAADMGGEFVPLSDRAKVDSLQDNDFHVCHPSDYPRLFQLVRSRPGGRFLYHGTTNSPCKSTQLTAAVNIGDHLRLASCDNSPTNLPKALRTLQRCLDGVEQYLREHGPSESNKEQNYRPVFAKDRNFGFVAYNPAEVGSGLSLRFLLRLPLLKRLPNFTEVLAEVTKDVKEVSLPPALADVSELLCLASSSGLDSTDSVLQGVIAVLKMESDLHSSNPNHQPGGNAVESLEFLKARIDERRDCKSYTRKLLTRALVGQCKSLETSFGGRLAHCVRVNAYSNAVFPRATDPEAFHLFKHMFEPILRQYNGVELVEHPAGDLSGPPPDLDFSHPQIRSFRVRVARNVDGLPFSPIITPTERAIAEHRISAALSRLKGEFRGRYYSLAGFDSSLLADPRLLLSNDNDRSRQCGVYRAWPENRGVFVFSQFPNAVVKVNDEDHFRLVVLDTSGKALGRVFEMAAAVMSQLDAVAPGLFAADPKLGFVNCCPSEVGTGMRISALVKLRRLQSAGKEEELAAVCKEARLQIRGSRGEHTAAEDGVFDVSVKARLGISEGENAARLVAGMKRLIEVDES